MELRLSKLKEEMSQNGLDAFLITKDVNQRYLEGYTGSECYLLITGKANYLIADSRYTEMAASECRSAEVVRHRHPYPPYNEVISGLCASAGVRSLGFEDSSINYSQYAAIKCLTDKAGINLSPVSNMCEKIRALKDTAEVECVKKACGIADEALSGLISKIKPGVSEAELVTELEYLMAGGGSESPSFDTMVLFGARASCPHAVPSNNVKLCRGDFILIDYGATYEGYMSDTTRTFVFGKASDEQKDAYARVLRSQVAGINELKAGVRTKIIDEVSRELLLGDGCFSYGVGHGVGLEIHELPSMSPSSDAVLENGMVVTVEPGIYIPGWGGIRIEDTVFICGGGHEILTKFPKDELIEL